jgi:diguanylate cyclase (GGDEF)-like protein
MSWLQRWWHQSDQYEWMTQFLRQRGLLRPTQLIMATVAGSASMVPLSVLIGVQRSPEDSLAVGIVGIAFTLAMTGYWLTRWPSRRLSEVSVVLGVLFAAVWSLAQPTAAVSVLACTATAVTGGYMAFFHGTKVLLVNFVVALATALVACFRLAEDTDLATAIGAFWLIWFLNMSVPLAARGASRALRVYTVRSDADPLTGLLNRRAFVETLTRLLVDGDTDATHVTIAMVDLDDFKRINDTHGHAAGDAVLREVADLLRQHNPPAGVVCRAGGEEFLVAMPGDPTAADAAMRQLCSAIATLPHDVTASIGTNGFLATAADEIPPVALIEERIAAADQAMYAAKRDGGNRVQRS